MGISLASVLQTLLHMQKNITEACQGCDIAAGSCLVDRFGGFAVVIPVHSEAFRSRAGRAPKNLPRPEAVESSMGRWTSSWATRAATNAVYAEMMRKDPRAY